jgi:hypothetical protein
MITRVPKWPKNKDELVTGFNDTWDCFNCAHMPRKVTCKSGRLRGSTSATASLTPSSTGPRIFSSE